MCSRICTIWPENPHIGACGVPFMNNTTSLPLTSLSMNCSMLMGCPVCAAAALRAAFSGSRPPKLPLRRAGLQGERVQLAAHFGLERLIDDLVLLHPRLAAEGFRQHGGGIVVAVSGQVADGYLGVRQARLDQPLDVTCSHGHGSLRGRSRRPAGHISRQPTFE